MGHRLEDVPRQLGRTQRFSLGVPRRFKVAEDGSRVLFTRSRGGADRTSCLWVLDERGERLLVDPAALGGEGALPAAELARRERVRERSVGIVSFSADRYATWAVFSLGGDMWVADTEGDAHRVPCVGSPVDARLDPEGRRVAYVSDGALRVLELADGGDRELAAPESPDVVYGLPEHVAAEEMHRLDGHWWSPDGSELLVTRVDSHAVQRWWIADLSDPSKEPRSISYPVAGTANADVSLFVLDLEGERREVRWDRREFEYLATAGWDRHGPIISVQSRDQHTVLTLAVDPESGETTLLWEDTNPVWVRLVPGTPARTVAGRLVVVSDVGSARRLVVDGEPVTGDELQVREVLDVVGETVWFVASTDPTELHVWTYTSGQLSRETHEPGLHSAAVGAETAVVQSFTQHGHRITITGPVLGGSSVPSLEEAPVLEPRVEWHSIGPRRLRTALVLPGTYERGSGPLPVLMAPYGGPAAQRVTRARHWYFVEAQWFADQGFAVVIADGAGTPGRGPAWEREIFGDVLTPVIADQVAALHGLAEHCGDLDLGRVGIRGWSFGGLLALASVLRRPDVFHAAVAGAAPTDMRLYDTHYRERYLGHPDDYPENYVRCSPVYEAESLSRPLLMIHGIADDNVVVANALHMSEALLRAGRPHELVLLPAATHISLDSDVDANLLIHELRFLQRSLAVRSPDGDGRD